MNKLAIRFLLPTILVIALVIILSVKYLSDSSEQLIRNDSEKQIELTTGKIIEEIDLTNNLVLEQVKNGMNVLVEQSKSLGKPEINGEDSNGDPLLAFGGSQINLNYGIVDRVKKLVGGTATFFVKRGSDYLRISTNVKKADGSRAVGTVLDPNGKAYAAINSGSAYYGLVNILGEPYLTGYEPIKNETGSVIGVYYTGYMLSSLSVIGERISNARILQNGIITLLNEKDEVVFISNNIAKDEIKNILDKKETSDGEVWEVEISSYANWNYKIVAAFPESDIYAIVSETRNNVIIGGIFVLLILIAAITYLVSRMILRPIAKLNYVSHEVAKGNNDVYVEINSKDEFGNLANSFNIMIQNIKESILSIKEKEHKAEQAAQKAMEAEHQANEQKEYLAKKTRILLAAMNKFAQGDLTVNVEVEKHDEIGELYKGFNKSVQNIKEMIFEVTHSVEQTKRASGQILESADGISTGAHEQSAQTNDVAAAVEEMTRTIYETSKNAQSASQYSKDAAENASAGGKVVSQTVDGMLKISEAVEQVAGTVKHLGANSQMIGEIVQVINDIADQTNLLALNAAIEAARAGEQGRGFAVVADEVRKLAERTSKATKEIADMIKQIQHDTNDAVSAMDLSTKRVNDGKILASQAGSSLSQIINNTDKVSSSIDQVAAASEEQSSAAEEISKNIESINNVSQQTAHDISKIAEAAEELNMLTDNLYKLVGRFNLGNNSALSLR